MTDEVVPNTCQTGFQTSRRDTEGDPAAPYDEWSDERLVDGYRRNSRLLREYGTDRRTIRALCAIEERLRTRGIDPDRVVASLED